MLILDAGEASGSPKLLVGTVSAPDDLESFEQIEEIMMGAAMQEYSIDLTTYTGDNSYLMFKLDGVFFEYFSMDNIRITESFTQTYNVAFQVSDQYNNALENASVNFNELTLTTDEEGFVVFEDIEEGEYDYIVNYEEFEVISGTIFVDGDEFEYVVFTLTNISEIHDSEIEMFPNPADNQVKLKSGSTIESLELYNHVGQLVKQINTSSKLININTSDFESGVYFIKVFSHDNVITKKLIIE